jgi:TRAP transporter TAXI family solute receptor
MNTTIKVLVVLVFCASSLLNVRAGNAKDKTFFVTIGSGDITGVYYPTGLIIAKLINEKREKYGIRAAVESTRGSVFNLNALIAGYLEFGLAQSDKQYQAVMGLSEWTDKGPQKDLCAVFSIHPETVTLVAAVDAGIKTIADLRGKRVNLGNPGSGQLQNSKDALGAAGLNPEKDIIPVKLRVTKAPGLLEDGAIDAFFCTVGHPSQTLKETVAGSRKVRFIPITGPGIEKLIAENRYYTKAVVPVRKNYLVSVNPVDVQTFGVKATLCTSARVPDDVVYAIAKEVFDNLEEVKKLHPAYADLTKEGMLEGLSAPIHPGAMKYFREAGLIR